MRQWRNLKRTFSTCFIAKNLLELNFRNLSIFSLYSTESILQKGLNDYMRCIDDECSPPSLIFPPSFNTQSKIVVEDSSVNFPSSGMSSATMRSVPFLSRVVRPDSKTIKIIAQKGLRASQKVLPPKKLSSGFKIANIDSDSPQQLAFVPSGRKLFRYYLFSTNTFFNICNL